MSPIIWSVTFLFVKYSSSFVLILVAFFMGYKKLFVLGIFRVPACPFVYAPLDRYHENVKLLIVFLMGTAVCIARKKTDDENGGSAICDRRNANRTAYPLCCLVGLNGFFCSEGVDHV